MRKRSKTSLPWWQRLVQRFFKKQFPPNFVEVDYDLLQHHLGYRFQHVSLLRQSLTHRSFANESGDPDREDNEKFEFLGDSVLGFVISDLLYHCFPRFSEGDMSRVKSHIVSESFLASLARELDLGSFLMLGKGESYSGGHEKSSLLANCYEAIIAAIYIDGGIEPVTEFIVTCFKERVETMVHNRHILDHKSLLQEHAQELFHCVPHYRLRRATGPDHERTFEVDLIIKGEVFSVGTGKNRKEAEQSAAKAALAKLNISEGKSQP